VRDGPRYRSHTTAAADANPDKQRAKPCTVVEEIQRRKGMATAERARRHSHHPACLCGVPCPYRSCPLQASGQPLVHVRKADKATPPHRGNVEVRDRESLADQVTGCRQSLIEHQQRFLQLMLRSRDRARARLPSRARDRRATVEPHISSNCSWRPLSYELLRSEESIPSLRDRIINRVRREWVFPSFCAAAYVTLKKCFASVFKMTLRLSATSGLYSKSQPGDAC
jgi:hypothetical protein